MIVSEALQTEIDERVQCMRDSGDNEDQTDEELVCAALEDILVFDAEDHVGAAQEGHQAFIRDWRELQKAARRRLAALRK